MGTAVLMVGRGGTEGDQRGSVRGLSAYFRKVGGGGSTLGGRLK